MIATALVASCNKSETEVADEKSSQNIETFVSAQLSEHEGEYSATYNDGVVRLTMVEGLGEGLQRGGSITFSYAGYKFTGTSISASNLFATNISSIASEAGWSLSGEDAFTPVTVSLDGDSLLKGLQKGLEGVKSGEDCYILFTSKYGYGKSNYGTISANTALAYRVMVETVQN